MKSFENTRSLRKRISRVLLETPITAMRIVLASGSQHRLALLRQIGIEPIVKVSDFAENLSKKLPVVDFVEQTARCKALAVADSMDSSEFDIIIGCDTVITIDNEIIGKPKTLEEAKQTLKRLSNRTHEVFSGVAIINSKRECELFNERTEVTFSEIPAAVIEEYVNSGEPMGRAGSYGIQARGAMFVERISGCYCNVVGLPINKLAKRLWKMRFSQ